MNTPSPAPQPLKAKRSWREELADPTSLLLLIFTLFFVQRALFVWVAGRAPLFGAVFDDTSLAYGNWACRILAGVPANLEGASPMPPLYAYLLAGVYKLVSGSLGAARLVNALLTCLAGWAAYDAGRRLASPAVGLLACTLYFLHDFTMFYEGVLDGGTLMGCLGALAFWALVVAAGSRRPLAWLGAGVAVGLLALAAGSPALLVGLAALGALPLMRRRAWMAALLLVLGLMLPLAPSLAHNLAGGGGPVLVSWNVGGALYNGNNSDNPQGIYLAPSFTVATMDDFGLKSYAREAERRTGRPLSAFQVSAYWAGEAWRFLRDRPGQFLALQARKLLLFWNRYDMPGALDPDLAAKYAWPLRTAPLGFGLLAPLGLAGAVWAWRRGAPGRVAVLYLCTAAAMAFPFTILGRRRLPLMAALAVLAAYLIGLLWERARTLRERRPAAGQSPARRRALRWMGTAALAVAGAALLVNQGWVSVAGSLSPNFNDYTLATYYSRLGQFDKSVAIMEEAVRASPDRLYLRFALAEFYRGAGRTQDALAACEQALRITPGRAQDYVTLARFAVAAGDGPKAAEAARRALALEGQWSQAHCALSEALLLAGDAAGAVEAAREAIQLEPAGPAGYNDLGLGLEALGDVGAARAAWQEAVRAAPEYQLARDNLARTSGFAPESPGGR